MIKWEGTLYAPQSQLVSLGNWSIEVWGFWNYLPFGAVQLLSHVQLFATPWTAAHQGSLTFTNLPRTYSNSCPLSQWCHPTISPSVNTFSSCLLSFPASRSFPISRLFTSGGQSFGASALVLPMNIQDWFQWGWTGFISMQSKGLSRVFSNITVQKHQFFGV